MSRRSARREARDQIYGGYGKISQGEKLIEEGEKDIASGRRSDPGPMKVFRDLVNPFSLSEFPGEEIAKGVINFAGGILVIAVSAEAAKVLQFCSAGDWVAGGLIASGFIHSLVGFRGMGDQQGKE